MLVNNELFNEIGILEYKYIKSQLGKEVSELLENLYDIDGSYFSIFFREEYNDEGGTEPCYEGITIYNENKGPQDLEITLRKDSPTYLWFIKKATDDYNGDSEYYRSRYTLEEYVRTSVINQMSELFYNLTEDLDDSFKRAISEEVIPLNMSDITVENLEAVINNWKNKQ